MFGRRRVNLKIIVMSDSHGVLSSVRKVVRLQHDADLFVFLGDGERDINQILLSEPWLEEKLLCLKGNCDGGLLIPKTAIQLEYTHPYGHKIFAAHGDRYQVKFGTARMVWEAKERSADIVLYGHTHCRDERYEDGVYILNPGSLGWPRDGKKQSYGVISVSENGVLTNIADVPLYG